MATLAKDFHRLMKRINKLSGGQARVDDVDWDDNTLDNFTLVIQPNASYYKDGTFKFKVKIPDGYPSEMPPAVWCETDIYHPNIDPTDECYDDNSTNVCCNIFDLGNWNPNFGLEGVVLGLIFLMHNPNYNDPLSPYFEPCPDEEEFTENVHRYMTGQDIDGHVFNIDFALPTDLIIEEQVAIVRDENIDTKSAQEIDNSSSESVEGCNSSSACAVATTADNVEVTEESMLNMLHERDDRIYTCYVDKSVAEQAEAAEENCIDMLFVDGEFMIAQAHVIDVSVTEATSNESDSLSDVDRSVAVMQDMVLHTASTHEEYMVQLLQEREIDMFNEYVNKSVAELNGAGGLTNVAVREMHVCDNGVASVSETDRTDMTGYSDPSGNERGANKEDGPNTNFNADACNIDEQDKQAMCETSGASSNDTIVTNCAADDARSCQTICLSKFQRSLSTPHEEASTRATVRLLDASINTFRYFMEIYNPSKWY